jgi:hypothetical protein
VRAERLVTFSIINREVRLLGSKPNTPAKFPSPTLTDVDCG